MQSGFHVDSYDFASLGGTISWPLFLMGAARKLCIECPRVEYQATIHLAL
jgi:hypothetical protein